MIGGATKEFLSALGHPLATRIIHWEPIAGAPQDGTRLMLWDSVSKRPVFGSWRGDSAAITHYAAEPPGPEAALLLGRPVDLLDQDGASRIEAQELQVVPSAALGADEAGSVGVDQVGGGLPRNVQLAEVTSEHEAGVRPEGDGQATAIHSAHNVEMVERVAKAMQAAEQAQAGWTWEDCSPIEVEGWMDLARAAIAA